MTNMRSGTTMMSGCGILTNGKGTRREYGNFNLDDLAIGDRIAMTRKSNGDLHFYVNGLDQGVAATNVPSPVWGVVDLYGRTVKVSLIDSTSVVPISNFEREICLYSDEDDPERLTFYPKCGSHVAVVNEGRTAYRPNALEDFNNGVVLTARPLHANELFEVKLDKIITKWAGSIEIGVTTFHPNELEYPSTMTNIQSGTWMMTGKGIMHNGSTIIDNYGSNLDCLKVNDRVGVRRTETGVLHFYVNGLDQGVAALDVPEKVYGVIDLYGQASEATIVEHIEEMASPDAMNSSLSTSTLYRLVHMKSDLRLSSTHGRHSSVYNGGLTAHRPNAYMEYEGAIVMSSRPLREDEKFEVKIDRLIDGWRGSIQIGVTLHKPEEIEHVASLREVKQNIWYLQGSKIVSNNSLYTENSYDLDMLKVGTVIGIRRLLNSSICITIDDDDKGDVFQNVPSGVYVIMDLYGRCAKISIAHNPQMNENSSGLIDSSQVTMPIISGALHRFSTSHGKSITLYNKNTFATRSTLCTHGLVFSSQAIEHDEFFQVCIERQLEHWAGALKLGVTNLVLKEEMTLPSSLAGIGKDIWYISGSSIFCNKGVIKQNYGPNLDRLSIGDCIGIKVCSDGTLRYFINGRDLGVAAWNLQKNLLVVIDLYGSTRSVSIVSSKTSSTFKDLGLSLVPSLSGSFHGCSDLDEDYKNMDDDKSKQEFHENAGRNIRIYSNNQHARKTGSYNNAIIVMKKPAVKGKLYQIKIDKINALWSSSLMVGVIAMSPDKLSLPSTALGFRKNAWIICGDSVFHNSYKVQSKYGPDLDNLAVKNTVGVLVDDNGALHLYVNNIDQGIAAKDLPPLCYVILDLYGQCEDVSLICSDDSDFDSVPPDDENSCPPAPGHAISRNCEYKNACMRCKFYLGIPAGYFVHDQCICFCELCFKMRGEQPYVYRGNPPREFEMPLGWCKFPLRSRSTAASINNVQTWNVAYHCCDLSAVRRVLDAGELLHPGDLNLFRTVMATEKWKTDGEAHQIVLSPAIKYAQLSGPSSQEEFKDPLSGKHLLVSVGFEVYIKPGSFKVGPASSDVTPLADGYLNEDSLEWVTSQKGNTVLLALLIKISGL